MLSADDKTSDGIPARLVFPGEHPDIVDLQKWIQAADAEIAGLNWEPLVANRMLPSLAQYAEKDLTKIPMLSVGGDITAGMVENRIVLRAQWEHDNEVNAVRREEYTRDQNNQLAEKLSQWLRPKAGLRLQRLLDAHKLSAPHAALHDGGAMMRELKTLASNPVEHEDAERHKRDVEKLVKDKLPAGCHVQDFADKVNCIIRDHNEYLEMK